MYRKTLHDGFFDDALAVRNRKKLAFDRMSLDRKSIQLPDPILPRQISHALKQLLKAECGKASDQNKNVLCTPQMQIGTRHILFAPLKKDTSVHGFGAAKTQRVNFFPQ